MKKVDNYSAVKESMGLGVTSAAVCPQLTHVDPVWHMIMTVHMTLENVSGLNALTFYICDLKSFCVLVDGFSEAVGTSHLYLKIIYLT